VNLLAVRERAGQSLGIGSLAWKRQRTVPIIAGRGPTQDDRREEKPEPPGFHIFFSATPGKPTFIFAFCWQFSGPDG